LGPERCLEVGAGGGSIAAWLCEMVGESGKVVVMDIDVRSLEVLQGHASLQVHRHDIVRDELEFGKFDLIHARLVLEHLPERDVVLAKIVRALCPGGWIVVEDVDYVSGPPISDFGAVEHGHMQSVRLREFATSGTSH
jgi:2-polyprenyl-3-methyl-5-hydroxy-6-metoxy-1,4-benzoquinol methylase